MKAFLMNGAGNDFAVVDARNINIDMSNMAKELCEKYQCDGFMALDNSDIADIKLHFYNCDGSRAEMCGNGARCICRFAYDNGIVGKTMTVETDAGRLFGERISDNIYRIRMSDLANIALSEKDGIDFAVVGVPHIVIEAADLDWNRTDELFERARKLRNALDANVNFYKKVNEDTVSVLTYERGVEDFTLACGTGSSAVAAVLWSKGEAKSRFFTIKNRGGDLKVLIESDKNKITALYLEGGAEVDKIVLY